MLAVWITRSGHSSRKLSMKGARYQHSHDPLILLRFQPVEQGFHLTSVLSLITRPRNI